MSKPHGANSETSAATKRRILDAAVAELQDSEWADDDPFPSVSLLKVAQRAGISRNGLANHFPSKAAFSRALMDRLLSLDDFWNEDYTRARELIAESSELPPLDALARVAEYELQQLREHADWPISQALQMRAGRDPGLAAVSREGYARDTRREWELVLGPLLERAGRMPRPPLSGEDVAAVYIALLEGAGMRQFVGDEALTGTIPRLTRRTTLFSLAALALLLELTTADADQGEPVAEIDRYWDLSH